MKIHLDDDCCMNCDFFFVHQNKSKKELGECHRYPPRAISDNTNYDRWPIVRCEDICGEYLRRAEPIEKSKQKYEL